MDGIISDVRIINGLTDIELSELSKGYPIKFIMSQDLDINDSSDIPEN